MKSKRNGGMDFWKFAFSIIIVLFHSRGFAGNSSPIFIGGSIAVDFFFIVSGVYMTKNVYEHNHDDNSLGKNTLNFMKRKICGLMPNIVVAYVFALIFIFIRNPVSIKVMVKKIVGSVWELLFVTQAGLHMNDINGVTWYIGAMLISMLIIYPLLLKFKDTFSYIIAPIMVILILGFVYQNWSSIRGPWVWTGYAYRGLVRGFVEILIGCICYHVGSYIQKYSYTKLMKYIFTLIEYGSNLFVFVYIYKNDAIKWEMFIIMLFAISITISYAQVSIFSGVMNNNVFSWLGKFSFSLYLAHVSIAHIMSSVFKNQSYMEIVPKYLALACISGLVIMYVSVLIKKIWNKYRLSFKKLFVVS